MTFRTRLVLAATVAVVFAVLAASSAAYLASRNALYNSVDDSLLSTASSAIHGEQRLGSNSTTGLIPQVVTAAGNTILSGGLPVDSSVIDVASGQSSQLFTDLSVNGVELRELVTHLPSGLVVQTGSFPAFELESPGAALQLATPITGLNGQLGDLRLALILVALSGIVLATLLGWLVARAALVPLDGLTASVEEIAESTDVSERLDAGGPDELGRLRRAFNRLLEALDTSREAQRQLVLDASHEMRTPLTSLRTNLEVLRRVDELEESEREILIGDVLTQLGELTDLVADLAELARGEVPRHESAPLRLDAVVEDAVALAASHGRGRAVTFELTSEETWVKGQRERIAKAVANLLDNALKWSPDGGKVEVHCAGGQLSVADHGPGISPDDLPHIFDRFYRAPGARALPGSGLGLAIVAQVARDEQGAVRAGEAPGGGALFTLTLPEIPTPVDYLDDDD
jgi:two-component system sensor histidine kinase MprB